MAYRDEELIEEYLQILEVLHRHDPDRLTQEEDERSLQKLLVRIKSKTAPV